MKTHDRHTIYREVTGLSGDDLMSLYGSLVKLRDQIGEVGEVNDTIVIVETEIGRRRDRSGPYRGYLSRVTYATAMMDPETDSRFRVAQRPAWEDLSDFVARVKVEFADARNIAFRADGGRVVFWLDEWASNGS